MSDSMTTIIIIISEVAAFFAVIIVITIIFRIRSGVNLKRSAKNFIKRIKNENSEHSDKLKNILLNDYDLDAQAAEQAVENLIQQEHSLFTKIIGVYLGDKNVNLDDFNDEIKKLTEIMHSVTVNSPKSSTKGGGDDLTDNKFLTEKFDELQKKLNKVQKEKEQAQSELRDALDTMEGMMTEYASMYAGGVNKDSLEPDKDIAKVKDKIEEIKSKSEKTGHNEFDNTDEVDLNLDVPDLDVDNDKT